MDTATLEKRIRSLLSLATLKDSESEDEARKNEAASAALNLFRLCQKHGVKLRFVLPRETPVPVARRAAYDASQDVWRATEDALRQARDVHRAARDAHARSAPRPSPVPAPSTDFADWFEREAAREQERRAQSQAEEPKHPAPPKTRAARKRKTKLWVDGVEMDIKDVSFSAVSDLPFTEPAAPPPAAPLFIRAKFPGHCRACDHPFFAGTQVWYRAQRGCACAMCGPDVLTDATSKGATG